MDGYCGCCFLQANVWQYLPQLSLKAHATILSSTARTTLTQTFVNPSESLIKEVSYNFPLYDGVSIVGFKCRVGSCLLHSKVKTREQANADYQESVDNQQVAAIMDHSSGESDIFVIRLGNIPAKETITVDITFVGELKQDSQMDGIRYTLPNAIAPRYGNLFSPSGYGLPARLQGIDITVDVLMEKTSVLRELQSPSHSVKVSLGRTSSTPADPTTFEPSKASATLRIAKENQALLERDFVLLVKADGLDNPRALLESHPTIPGQRALMATLVPKFGLPPAQPEVVFVIDRSASMCDKISTLKAALKIFLKSLPAGIYFNFCSFGSTYSFLWPASRVYDASSLNTAVHFVDTIDSNMGGTEMQAAVEATVKHRLKKKDLEVLILTDGQIAEQQALFSLVRDTAADNTARFFSLAIGDAASHSLVEGIARSGNGSSQSVLEYEELDRKAVRMLKGALTPHIYDYKLEVAYDGNTDDDFEVLDTHEPIADSETEVGDTAMQPEETPAQQPISLFDANFKESDTELGTRQEVDDKSLPNISLPKALQAPYKIPPLYPFIRTTVYVLLDPRSSDQVPQSLTFSATSKQGPLQLRIPISESVKGETIHQLASRKAVVELEEDHGWLNDAHDDHGNPFKQLHCDTKQRIAVRECQALGIKYQVTGKYCSFVALQHDVSDESAKDKEKQKPKEMPLISTHKQFPLSALVPGSGDGLDPPMSHALLARVEATMSTARTAFGSVFGGGFGSSGTPARGALRSEKAASPFQQLAGGSSLFGGPPPQSQPATGSLFGGPPPQSQPATGALFGGPPPQPRSATKSLFGSSAQPSTGVSLFGNASVSSDSSSAAVGAPFSMQSDDIGPPEVAKTTAETRTSKVHALVALQTFEGNWEWTQDLFNVLGYNMNDMQAQVVNVLQTDKLRMEQANVVATLLAMGFLVRKNADSRGTWELVYGKAEGWVTDKLAQMGIAGSAIDNRKSEIMSLI